MESQTVIFCPGDVERLLTYLRSRHTQLCVLPGFPSFYVVPLPFLFLIQFDHNKPLLPLHSWSLGDVLLNRAKRKKCLYTLYLLTWLQGFPFGRERVILDIPL